MTTDGTDTGVPDGIAILGSTVPVDAGMLSAGISLLPELYPWCGLSRDIMLAERDGKVQDVAAWDEILQAAWRPKVRHYERRHPRARGVAPAFPQLEQTWADVVGTAEVA